MIPRVTYKGLRPIISKSTIIQIGANAFINASRIMFQKICNYLSILSTVLVLGILGGGFFTYKYVTSPQFQSKMMNKVLGEVKGLLPKVLDQELPQMTGPSMPTPTKPSINKLKL